MKDRGGPPRILSPEDIRNAQFGTTRMRAGYDMDDVDEFLDRVEASVVALLAELRRVQEAEELLRQQFNQLQARSGGSPYSSTAIQRAPGAMVPATVAAGEGDVLVEQALAQAAAVRQGLIAQLRSHVAAVNAQIQAVAAALPDADPALMGTAAMGTAATRPITTSAPAESPLNTGPLPSTTTSAPAPAPARRAPASSATAPVPRPAPAPSGFLTPTAQSPQAPPALATESTPPEATGPLPAWSEPTQEIPRIVD